MKAKHLFFATLLAFATTTPIIAQETSGTHSPTVPAQGKVAPKTSHVEDDGDRITVARGKFSDQAKPGTLLIDIPCKKLKIKGTSGDEVIIISELDQKGRPRIDGEGFRRLDENETFDLVEESNTAKLALVGVDFRRNDLEFTIYVPVATNIILLPRSKADIKIEHIQGDVEYGYKGSRSVGGSLEMKDISGAIVINGGLFRTNIEFSQSPTRPVTIESISRGAKTTLELPSAAKATFLLRTNGGIRTSFSEKKLKLDEPAMPEEKVPAQSREQREFFPIRTGLLNGGGTPIEITNFDGIITIKEDD